MSPFGSHRQNSLRCAWETFYVLKLTPVKTFTIRLRLSTSTNRLALWSMAALTVRSRFQT